MSETNRHREPSTANLVRRIYRRQIESDKIIRQLQGQLARLGSANDISAVIASHCQRLLREKATLLKVIEANKFMAEALPRREDAYLPCPCVFKDKYCRYSGPETTCDKSPHRCRELGNFLNFQGWAYER